ncbi:hypothetical protein [Mycobacterium phage WXIN]|nr:hypothetical protein [Mycobacterium phage WXIN]
MTVRVDACIECGATRSQSRISRGLCMKHYYLHKNRGTLEAVALPPARGRQIDLWEAVKSSSAHFRVRRLWGPAYQYPCIECGEPANEWAYDGTDPTQLYGRERESRSHWTFYSRFPEFYMPMCSGCHRRRDCAKASEELHAYRLSQASPPVAIRQRTRPRPRPGPRNRIN